MARADLLHFLRVQFPPPAYLALPTVGIDISASGIKVVALKEKLHGLELAYTDEVRLNPGAVSNGEIADKREVIEKLSALAKKHHIRFANIALSESRGYLFEADAPGSSVPEMRTAIEQHIDEYVPLPPAETVFDISPLAKDKDMTHVVGVGYARRVVDELLAIIDSTGIRVRAMEGETFALARALLPHGDTETVLIIDIGRTTTKLMVVGNRMPRFTTTLDIGGHALTLAVQKYFGVTEEEAKRVKAERGLIAADGGDEYVAAMISTLSAVREEIARRLEYWQSRAGQTPVHQPVTRAILVGGNATVRGLPEYLEASLKIPVALGDIFVNLAPKDDWLPPIDYLESLAYGTATGLALRDYVP